MTMELPQGTWDHQLIVQWGLDRTMAASVIPPGLAAAAWSPSEADKELAWQMYTQLRTRIATQPLPLRDGVESAALKSLVDLFDIARGEIAKRREAHHAASLLVHCLNAHVRPLTARWHPKLEAGELANLDRRFRFRADLVALQSVLRAFTAVFGRIADDEHACEFLRPVPAEVRNTATSQGHLKFGVLNVSGVHGVSEMNAEEARLVTARRAGKMPSSAAEVYDGVGLAISGGGIRSATFALGVTQVLAKQGVLKDVDVLSTVSGGSYLGGFISSVLNVPDKDVGLGANDLPFARSGEIESSPIRQLRNHSKYLAEGGLPTLALMVFSALYGAVISFLLIAPLLLLLAAVAVFVFYVNDAGVTSSPAYELVNRVVWIALGVAVIILSVLRSPSRKLRETVERSAIALVVIAFLLLVHRQLPTLIQLTYGRALGMVSIVVLMPAVLAACTLWWGAKSRLGRLAWSLLALFGPLLFLSLWLLAIEAVVVLGELSPWLPWIVTGLLLLYACLGVNINFASLHLYYRNRLAETYLRRVRSAKAEDPQPLSGLNAFHKGPLHLINAAVNLPASRNPELRGRNTDFFVFAQHYCGGPSCGYWPTAEWEARDKHLDLGTAMAVSGAAAAPRMGTFTSSKYTTLLAMLNVRLGYWLRTPRAARIASRVPGGLYFAREILGRIHEDLPYVNLSDGGHIENMGLYELLRRRCRYMVVIDGEADPQHSFGGLLNALQMAQIDLGVRIEPDLADLRLGIEPFKQSHFAMARVHYTEDGAAQGLLLVIKLALTGNESELLMQYRERNPAFPHQSTAQQLFSESQFEAYRALGEHAADAAFDSLLVNRPVQNTRDWLLQLEEKLLPLAPVAADKGY